MILGDGQCSEIAEHLYKHEMDIIDELQEFEYEGNLKKILNVTKL